MISISALNLALTVVSDVKQNDILYLIREGAFKLVASQSSCRESAFPNPEIY